MTDKQADDLVFVGGARTAMAEYEGTPGGGAFKGVSAIDLGVHAVKGALERSGVSPEAVDHVVMGNVLQSSADALYGARHVGLKAGIPEHVPGLTVNRLCGSGIQAALSAAYQITAGDSEVVVAGGMENMSQAPFVVRCIRSGTRFGVPMQFEDSLLASLTDPVAELNMAQTAEKVAAENEITREAQDEFAQRSHELGAKAVADGLFKDEIVPVEVGRGKRARTVDTDDHIKPDSTLEGLSQLRAAFGEDGTVTAGNASGIVDAAAALVLTTRARAEAEGWTPLSRIVSWGVTGVDPTRMGIGPVSAIRQACEKAGMGVADVDLVEINEAFAAQYLACEKLLELDRERVNVNGGAVSIGHPLGATGARLLLTLTLEMRRREVATGVASACIGGGQGIAMLIGRED